MTVFIVVLGGFFISLVFFDNTAIEWNWNVIKGKLLIFNWYWNIPGNKNEIVLQIPLYFMGYHWGILFVSDLGINFRLLCMYV